MRIGLIDVDGHDYPNLPLMKLSAWHKQNGDDVEWYDAFSGLINEYDKVYMSKVFSFTEDYEHPVYAKEVIKGGSGYCISKTGGGREVFDKSLDKELPYEIEHIYPDYSLYPTLTENRAYGFLTRGCPRGCSFCHVACKEGKKSYKVADVWEFWNGQKKIELLDPNTLACKDWKICLEQLIETEASVNFNQGLDIRMMTDEKAEMLSKIPIDAIHFAWDRIEDEDIIIPRFEKFREHSKIDKRQLQVYVLVGDREQKILESDMHRIYWLRDHGFSPYVMIYNKDLLPKGHELRKLQRWCNNRYVFWCCERFEDYEYK